MLRSGNVVVAVLPKIGGGDRVAEVCLVLSVWNTHRKPRLATSSIPLDHCVAARLVVMKKNALGDWWECDGASLAWVVQPSSIVAVLDVGKCDNTTSGCKVFLTDESLKVLQETAAVPDWWPHLEAEDLAARRSRKGNGAKATKGIRRHLGLFVSRQGRRRRAGAKVKPSGSQSSNSKKGVKKSKKQKTKLKKSKKIPSIPESVENYTRTHKGSLLIRQVLEKARHLDSMKFKGQELFDPVSNLCVMKLEKCHGLEWSKILDESHGYFKCVFLSFCSM